MKWTGHVITHADKWHLYTNLVGRRERKRPLERPRCRWENITKLYLGDTKLNITDWIDFIQDWYLRRGLVNVAHSGTSGDTNFGKSGAI
jgi:hypothetical protein